MVARWNAVMVMAVKALDTSELKAFGHPLTGGGYEVIPDTTWNTEIWVVNWARFCLCRIDLHDSFNGYTDGSAFIYVSTSSLDALVARLDREYSPAVALPDERKINVDQELQTPVPKARRGGPNGMENTKAEAECAEWLWTKYVQHSETATVTQQSLLPVVLVKWDGLVSKRGLARAWSKAVAKAPNGSRQAWSLGNAVKRT